MPGSRLFGNGPAHAQPRRRSRAKAGEERLRALGERMTQGAQGGQGARSPAKERPPRAMVRIPPSVVVVIVVVVVVVLLGVQWFRPLPRPVFHASLTSSVRFPGTSPSLPWPTTGSSALALQGTGTIGQTGSAQSAPIASITKVMTAYVVLHDHPLVSGASGPAIAVDSSTVAAYQTGLATQQSVVKVAPGETLDELQVLQGLLIASGNDMATLLADWDAGGVPAFVAKMNTTAHDLGLNSTHYNDVSGLDPGSQSTPTDLIALGEAAMAIPAFRQIVSMAQVTLPLMGLVYNFDYDIGHDGIIGIKTGSDAAAGGCFLFEAQQSVGGKQVTVIGAVLGQQTDSPISAALSDAEALVQATFAGVRILPAVRPRLVVGHIDGAGGASVPVLTSSSPTVVAWPGLAVPVHLRVSRLPSPISAEARVGVLSVGLGSGRAEVVVRTSRSLPGPSLVWRLTRL